MGDSYQADRFKAAIKRIANYVGANSYDGISIQYFILKFKKLVLDIPANYYESNAPKTHIRIWEEEFDIHVNNKDRLNTNIGKSFSLIMGQCTEALEAKLRGLSIFQAVEDENYSIVFLRAIK